MLLHATNGLPKACGWKIPPLDRPALLLTDRSGLIGGEPYMAFDALSAET